MQKWYKCGVSWNWYAKHLNLSELEEILLTVNKTAGKMTFLKTDSSRI